MASPTYETLVAGLGLHLKTIGHRLFEEEPPPDWSVQPEGFSALVAPSTQASSKALLSRHELVQEGLRFDSDRQQCGRLA